MINEVLDQLMYLRLKSAYTFLKELSRFSYCRIFFLLSSISAVNSSRVFSLGFVMAGRSFLPVGVEKGHVSYTHLYP